MSEIRTIETFLDDHSLDDVVIRTKQKMDGVYSEKLSDVLENFIEYMKYDNTNNLGKVILYLSSKGIDTSNSFDDNGNYIDLKTEAKSHLHLYEDGTLKGRYDYETKLDLSKPIGEVVKDLCNEFNNALHGRSFGNEDWIRLCVDMGVKLEMYF